MRFKVLCAFSFLHHVVEHWHVTIDFFPLSPSILFFSFVCLFFFSSYASRKRKLNNFNASWSLEFLVKFLSFYLFEQVHKFPCHYVLMWFYAHHQCLLLVIIAFYARRRRRHCHLQVSYLSFCLIIKLHGINIWVWLGWLFTILQRFFNFVNWYKFLALEAIAKMLLQQEEMSKNIGCYYVNFVEAYWWECKVG